MTGLTDKRNAEARHDEIVSIVKKRGFVTINQLAKLLDVTVQTIRRDVTLLAESERVARFHGGIGLSSSVENIDYPTRRVLNSDSKQRIAQLVARHIPDHSSVFINIGTTTEAVANALVDHKELKFITNNINVARVLSSNPSFHIVIAGGSVRNRDGGIVGQSANDMIAQFRVDYAVIGISGIDDDGTLLDYDYDEVRAAQAIIKNASKVFLVADHTKFSRRPMVRVAPISDIDALFTDVMPTEDMQHVLGQHQVEVHVAAEDAADDINVDMQDADAEVDA